MSVRLNLFVKGNLDVCDALFGQRIGGKAGWNGINEVLRAANRAVTARVRHETNIGHARRTPPRAARRRASCSIALHRWGRSLPRRNSKAMLHSLRSMPHWCCRSRPTCSFRCFATGLWTI